MERAPIYDQVWDELQDKKGARLRVPRYVQQYMEETYERRKGQAGPPTEAGALRSDFRQFLNAELVPLTKLLLLWERHRRAVQPPRPRRRKPTNRNAETQELHRRLLAFVAERGVPVRRLLDGNLKPGRRGVVWEALRAEWNRLYPEQRIRSSQSLKVRHYRGAKDPQVADELREEMRRLKETQGLALLRRSCVVTPAAPPHTMGVICLLEFPSVRANPPADIREVLERAGYRSSEILKLLGIGEDEMRRHTEAVQMYLREQATREDLLARAALDPDGAERPLWPIDGQPLLKVCGACLRPYVLGGTTQDAIASQDARSGSGHA
jgi:hypothetical protein